MIFNDDPKLRARLWQVVSRMALGWVACHNALLGLAEPSSLTARALGQDSLVDMVQLVQVFCSIWVMCQAMSQSLRQSVFASLPFGFIMLSLLVQFWFAVIVGVSWVLAIYYMGLAMVFAGAALLAATNESTLHRLRVTER